LKVVSTWYTPTMIYGPGVLPFPPEFDPQHDSQTRLEATVRDTLGEHPDVKVSLVVVEGHAAPELLDQSEGAALLVLGSRGHGAFAGMLLGSVSEHCLSHAQCPVVVIRHAATPA
jgi:nucleotide-binding universal stress UspA family protein